ncbi:putative CoA-substrate-specific enzyme activase [Rhodobacter viridis]|uniref:Putative CoA-substrate-specific enzyme activase n=1 Tax=Rhodobacter viridis TaxID=1054202 RepID=A0A318U2E7_9RHOB|nr:2-hydroxyacyl-CoA dehydratase [Rhodobacter viridis]PYF12630.1 putative CoA-substrate-specific enzyme activase [Rhodobacter viridis]
MRFQDVIDPMLSAELAGATVLGIDIGSRGGKAVLLHEGHIHTAQVATGVFMQDTANELLEDILMASEIDFAEIDHIVATGYGRIALEFSGIATDVVTEISCHAMGAHFLNAATRTIIDIGGQDSKAIQVDPDTGKVIKFLMNDKCAAGTGRFLEKASALLGFSITEVGPASLRAETVPNVSSQCTVFAESEVISLRARGVPPEDIAAGLHFASARRVRNLVSKVPLEADLVFTGGVSNNVGMKHALETLIGFPITVPKLDMVYAGALGAAIYAQKHHVEAKRALRKAEAQKAYDFEGLSRLLQAAEDHFVASDDAKKVGYLCNYTPLELLNASGAAHLRLFKCGGTEEVSRGEQITKSVFCDFTKSVLGHFATKHPVNEAIDKVFTFYTCDSMRATSQAIDNFYKSSRGFIVPRNADSAASRAFFRQEILAFRDELETLTGREIHDEDLQAQIRLYNRVRALIRQISELRKRDSPALSGRDFLEAVRAFFYLEPEALVPLYEDMHRQLATAASSGTRPLRLMMCGGVVADGDRRILDLVEDDIGARIVVEDHCTGLGPFLHQTREGDDPWAALADAYLDQTPCARQFPLERRIEAALALARDYRVDAVLYTYLKFCPCYGLTKNLFLKRFQEAGIPVLELGSDYSAGDLGQIKTRLEAFVEVLAERAEA